MTGRTKTEGKIPDFHFGYGMYVRNRYIHPSKLHFVPMADDVSSAVEDFIYTIINSKNADGLKRESDKT